jgi:hypothetical protein
MRNILLTSTAAVCLMLTVPAANAQSDAKKHDETKKEQVQQPNRAEQQQQAQQHRQGRSTTGQASEEKKDAVKHESSKSDSHTDDTNKGASSLGDKKDQNAAGKSGTESDRHAQSEKSNRENSKSAAEQGKKSSPSKSTASEADKKSTASEQNKAAEAPKPSTAETPKSSTQRQESVSAPSKNTNAKTPPTDNTANNKSDSNKSAAGNNANAPSLTNNTNTADRKAGQIDPQKKVQISETISRTHDLAPPVRNLNISITVGERVPSHIHLSPLPREIVTIAPEYRGYDYFTTEEDVVIVSPRTHEIVTEIPRDASRARAQLSSSSTTSAMSGSASSAMPCQVMQRTASGDMQPIDPSRLRETTGSGRAGQDHLAVKVQGPNGQEMPEVALPDSQGRIIAETNGSDCRIIIEPGQTSR